MRILTHRTLAAATAMVAFAMPLSAQQPVIASNAPKDRPIGAETLCQLRAMYRATAPLTAQARATFPDAKQRFLTGLPPKTSFFVTARLRDDRGLEEQVFVAVDSAPGNQIVGKIWSQVELVRGFQLRQRYTMPDSEIVDWMFSRPDGTEEGNVVGKFLDTYAPPAVCADTARAPR